MPSFCLIGQDKAKLGLSEKPIAFSNTTNLSWLYLLACAIAVATASRKPFEE
jgi:hypothetical protein